MNVLGAGVVGDQADPPELSAESGPGRVVLQRIEEPGPLLQAPAAAQDALELADGGAYQAKLLPLLEQVGDAGQQLDQRHRFE
jgi:hypothetical protein